MRRSSSQAWNMCAFDTGGIHETETADQGGYAFWRLDWDELLLDNSTNAHIQVVSARMAATEISINPCVRVKAFGGTSWSLFWAFSVIMVKRVEEVAVVATQAVINPTPQITCPATNEAESGEECRICMPPMIVRTAER